MVRSDNKEVSCCGDNGCRSGSHEYATRSLRDIHNAMREPAFGHLLDVMSNPLFPFDTFLDRFDALDRAGELEAANALANIDTIGSNARIYYSEDGNSADVVIDLPRVSKDDVKLTWPNDHTFRVDVSKHEDEKQWKSYETSSIVHSLNWDVDDPEGIDAKLENGSLVFSVRKAQAKEPAVKTTVIK